MNREDLWLVSLFSNPFGFIFIGGVGQYQFIGSQKGSEELNRFVVLFVAIIAQSVRYETRFLVLISLC